MSLRNNPYTNFNNQSNAPSQIGAEIFNLNNEMLETYQMNVDIYNLSDLLCEQLQQLHSQATTLIEGCKVAPNLFKDAGSKHDYKSALNNILRGIVIAKSTFGKFHPSFDSRINSLINQVDDKQRNLQNRSRTIEEEALVTIEKASIQKEKESLQKLQTLNQLIKDKIKDNEINNVESVEQLKELEHNTDLLHKIVSDVVAGLPDKQSSVESTEMKQTGKVAPLSSNPNATYSKARTTEVKEAEPERTSAKKPGKGNTGCCNIQ